MLSEFDRAATEALKLSPPTYVACTLCGDKKKVVAKLGGLNPPKKGTTGSPSDTIGNATTYLDIDAPMAKGYVPVDCPRCCAPPPAPPKPDPLDNQPDLTRGELLWLKGVARTDHKATRQADVLDRLKAKGLIEIAPSGDVWAVTPAGRARLEQLAAS